MEEVDKSMNNVNNIQSRAEQSRAGISFLLPVYNVGQYIQACIESIVIQRIPVPYEIICVDDCSTDDTCDVLKEISTQFKCVKVKRNEKNFGVSYTRNAALAIAKYKYIWFIDPDDLLVNGSIAWMIEQAEATSADVVIGNYQRVEEQYCGKELFRVSDKTHYSNKLSEVLPTDDAGRKMCAIWAGLFSRKFLVTNHLHFQEGMIAQEDTLFYYEVDQCYPSVAKTNSVCYLYRARSTSVMHSRSIGRTNAYYESMKIMMNVYMKYWRNGHYRDASELQQKIHHMKENLALCLAMCSDETMVKQEIRYLRSNGYYPYPLRKESLNHPSKVMGMMLYLLPFSLFFWLEHWLFKTIALFRKSK